MKVAVALVLIAGLLVIGVLVVLLVAFGSLDEQSIVEFLEPNRASTDLMNADPLFVVVWGPFLETLLFQSLPIGFCRCLYFGRGVQMTASIALFFLAHLIKGVVSGIGAGLIGGFYLAFTYVRWRRRNWWTAFWVTWASHAINNGLYFLLLS